MSAWPVYGAAALYVVVSPLLNRVLAQAGLFAPLVCAVGGALLLLLALLWRRWGTRSLFSLLYALGMMIYFLVTTADVTNRYLYHYGSGLVLTIVFAIVSVVGFAVREPAMRYTCRLFFLIGAVLYGLIMLIGLRRWEWHTLFPVEVMSASSFLHLSLLAAIALSPLFLPVLSAAEGQNLRTLAISVGGIVLASLAALLSFPPHMLTRDKDLFIEVAKNLSLGRFFQRMEFPGALLFLVLSLLMILYTAVCIRSSVTSRIKSKPATIAALLALFFAAAVPAVLASRRDGTADAALILSGASAVIGLLWSALRSLRGRCLTVILLSLPLLLLSSCIEYREIDTYDYPLIVGVERAGEGKRYYFRTESATFTVNADTLEQAKEAANRQNAKPIDLSQLGMLILPADDPDIIVDQLQEIEQIDVENSVAVAAAVSETGALVQADFSHFHGVSEFFDEFRSHLDALDYIDRTVFEAAVSYKKDGTLMLTAVSLESGQTSFAGAVVYGMGHVVHINDDQLYQIKHLRNDVRSVDVEDSVLHIRLRGTPPQDVRWLADVYHTTGRDVLGAYGRLAVRCFDAPTYLTTRNKIQYIVVD